MYEISLKGSKEAISNYTRKLRIRQTSWGYDKAKNDLVIPSSEIHSLVYLELSISPKDREFIPPPGGTLKS